MLKPSLFYTRHPHNAVLQAKAAQVTARMCMKWLMEQGDRWQKIPLRLINLWHEEAEEGRKLSMDERKEIRQWCANPWRAMEFSPAWLSVGLGHLAVKFNRIGAEDLQAFTEFRQQGLSLVEVAEVARLALADGDFFDSAAEQMDLSDAAMKRVQTGLHYFCGPDHGRPYR